MISSSPRYVPSCFLGVAFAAIAFSASADPQPQHSLDPVVSVEFGDLNTSTEQGSRVLYDRIRTAVRIVCERGAHWDPREYFAHRGCSRATLDHVVAQLNLPLLTARHVAMTHREVTGPSLQAGNR